jgi:hypothetical protein
MTRGERRRRTAVTRLIAVRKRNDDVMSGLEAERDRLLTKASLIPSPVWRRRGPTPIKPNPRLPLGPATVADDRELGQVDRGHSESPPFCPPAEPRDSPGSHDLGSR